MEYGRGDCAPREDGVLPVQQLGVCTQRAAAGERPDVEARLQAGRASPTVMSRAGTSIFCSRREVK